MCILNCNFSIGIVASRSSIRNFSDRSYRPAVNQTINCLIEQNNAKQCKRITYKVRFNTVYPMNQKKFAGCVNMVHLNTCSVYMYFPMRNALSVHQTIKLDLSATCAIRSPSFLVRYVDWDSAPWRIHRWHR